MSNVKDFPTICQSCKRELEDKIIFYKHPRLGFICENCPEFEDGGINGFNEEPPTSA